jgi:hypothetical protein
VDNKISKGNVKLNDEAKMRLADDEKILAYPPRDY